MRKFIFFPAVLFILVGSIAAKADTWALPTEKTVCSSNNRYCLKITPKKLAGQLEYFQDKVDGKPNAGADKKVEENYCKGEFFAKDSRGRSKKLWTIPLVNEVSPVSALVSEDGSYVVTFDNWHTMGYGDNAVVIYRASDGSLVRKLALIDFLTENDYMKLSRSVSSIWWAGGKHRIEDGKLVLNVAGPGNDGHSENGERFFIDIDLATGAMLSEKKNHYKSYWLDFGPAEQASDDPANFVAPADAESCPGTSFSGADSISSDILVKRIVTSAKPKFPPAARAVRAQGTVNIQVLISENGDVLCAKAISGHLLLRSAITNAINTWKFEKSPTKYWGTLAVTGRETEVDYDGIEMSVSQD